MEKSLLSKQPSVSETNRSIDSFLHLVAAARPIFRKADYYVCVSTMTLQI